jgi:hypothetical protein
MALDFNQLVNQMSPDEVNAEFYAGYGDQPRSMTLMDYLNPASYIDPYKALRNPPPQVDEQGNRQLSSSEANRVYNDPRYNPNVSANAQFDKLFGGTNPTSVVSNFSMPNVGNLTNYIPKEIPNIFGQRNPLYEGLLGTEQSQALSKQSNIAGLLGFAAALAQGMGSQGGRRSAAQNIINALVSGYGSSGQAYQQGLQNYSQAQQLAIQQRQQAGIQAMKMKYPDLADEFDTNPAGAFRIVSEREAAAKKPTVVSEGGALVSPSGEVLFTAPAKNVNDPTSIREYEYYRSQGGNKSYEAFLKEKIPSTTVNVNTGQLSKGTQGKLEEEILTTGNAAARLNQIKATFRPEYLNIKFRGQQEWNTLKDKFTSLDPKDKAVLQGYSTYKQNSINNLNQTIKDLTGAAMGVQEAERIIAGAPNAGTGVFDGDSPSNFEAKLNNQIKQVQYALARKQYSLTKGLRWEAIPLEKMPEIVNQRGKEIEKTYNLDPDKPADKITVQRQLAAEFGISF